MTELIFQTPSRHCPYKGFNGQRITIVQHDNPVRLRRCGGRLVPAFHIALVANPARAFAAYGDELFILPKERT